MENLFHFRYARPVWEEGAEKAKNRMLSFCTDVEVKEGDAPVLYAAVACSFVVYVNGKVVAHGPARTAHGFFRVDALALAPHCRVGKNRVVIRATGYNIDSFAYLDQPAFFCAEILSGDAMLAATGVSGFTAYRVSEYLEKVQRFSYQRPFVEIYRLSEGAFGYESGADDHGYAAVRLAETAPKTFLCRNAPYGDFDLHFPQCVTGGGRVSYSEKEKYHSDRSLMSVTEGDDPWVGKDFFSKGFLIENQEYRPYYEIGRMDFSPEEPCEQSPAEITIPADGYVNLDNGTNETGLFAFELEVHESTELFVLFDEVLRDGVLNVFRFGPTNAVTVLAEPGKYTLCTAEPYVCRYIRLVAKKGSVTVRGFHMVKVEFPRSQITAKCTAKDPVLRSIYDAAVRTFCANVVDIYMDCPSRERAGWLCDSFFTSRVEKVLTGQSLVERDFLECFILRDSFPDIPKGMLPMCYPSDHIKRSFIPNWAMWYVLELKEYYDRTGDRALVDAAKQTVYALYDWFKPFENEIGLLEKVEGWIFVEWSMANKLVQDVSFATNMLYASFLSAIATLYDAPEEEKKADALRKTIREACMYNGFFCDNALRVDGKLQLSGECTEACQYYAFFCGVATPESHPELWDTLVRDFGFDRRETKKHPEIHFANAFIGNYLRLDLLRRFGYREMLESNIRDYFTYMAKETGTLWEYEDNKKSCNHGFASHVLHWMEYLGYIER